MIDPHKIAADFAAHYGAEPKMVIRAPGRVNLIGEHTDYNDGFVFPVAIDKATYIAASPRTDNTVRMLAADLNDSDSFDLGQIAFNHEKLWSNYIRGMAHSLNTVAHPIGGADLLITSDVPRGAGLSSSAALEVAVGYTFQLLYGLNILGEELALMAQGAENAFVGVQCGIMDQFIVTLGRADHALLIDCRDLSYREAPLPKDVNIVVCDSRIERSLAGSAYNQRREECAAAVAILKQHYPRITALRDVSVAQLAEHADELPEPVRSRARHVVSENARVLHSAAALEQGDVRRFGQLMNESHTSLQHDYEVSIPPIDTLVEIARQSPGCLGARLTGAGFGGCTVNLVDTRQVEAFCAAVLQGYAAVTGQNIERYVCRASDGVRRVV